MVNRDANEIINRLWLGDYYSSQNESFIRNNRITVIVNCTKDLPFNNLNGLHKYRVPVHDNLDPNEITLMGVYLKQILPIITCHYDHGHGILIHCAAGMQRSAIVVLCFLCSYYHVNPKLALNVMKRKRPIVFEPYMNFSNSFLMYFGPRLYNELFR